MKKLFLIYFRGVNYTPHPGVRTPVLTPAAAAASAATHTRTSCPAPFARRRRASASAWSATSAARRSRFSATWWPATTAPRRQPARTLTSSTALTSSTTTLRSFGENSTSSRRRIFRPMPVSSLVRPRHLWRSMPTLTPGPVGLNRR